MSAQGENNGDAASLAADIAARTDAYFNRTRAIVQRYGDKQVTYAMFLRPPADA
jgi:nicotinate phosphoribosyltransferase